MSENKATVFKETLKNNLSKTKYGLMTAKELDVEWRKLKKEVETLGDKYRPKYMFWGSIKCPICNKKLYETQKWMGFTFPIKSILYCDCGYDYPNEDWGD